MKGKMERHYWRVRGTSALKRPVKSARHMRRRAEKLAKLETKRTK